MVFARIAERLMTPRDRALGVFFVQPLNLLRGRPTATVGLERCGHDFEPGKSPVSKLDLVLTGKAAKDNFTAEPHCCLRTLACADSPWYANWHNLRVPPLWYSAATYQAVRSNWVNQFLYIQYQYGHFNSVNSLFTSGLRNVFHIAYRFESNHKELVFSIKIANNVLKFS